MTSYLWHNQISAQVDWIVKFDDDIAVTWDKLLPNFSDVVQRQTDGEDQKLYCHIVLRNRPSNRPEKHLGKKL